MAGTVNTSEPDPERIHCERAEELLEAFLEDERAVADRQRSSSSATHWPRYEPRAVEENPIGTTILAADREVQVAVVRAWFDRTLRSALGMDASSAQGDTWRADRLVNRLLRRNLPYTDGDIQWIVRNLRSRIDVTGLRVLDRMNIAGLFRAFARSVERADLSDDTRRLLQEFQNIVAHSATYASERKIVDLIDEMLGTAPVPELIDPSDDWGRYASEAFATLPDAIREPWAALIEHAGTISGARPSQRWRTKAAEIVSRMGEDTFTRLARTWFVLLDRPSRGDLYRARDGYDYPTAVIADRNADMLKGLAWACTTLEGDALAASLGDAALACYKKVPDYGARSTKAGNACVQALRTMASLPAIMQLQRVLQRVKLTSQRKQVEGALASAAQELGLSFEDLDELVVATYGFVDGTVRRAFGDVTAEIAVRDSSTVDLHWLRPDRKAQKSVPAEIKREHPDGVKDLKQLQKENRDVLAAQRARIERLMIRDRAWLLSDWRERYRDHPLVSILARRLIWTFNGGGRTATGIFCNGEIVDAHDQPLDWLDDGTTVRIWHPIESNADDVRGWREWLDRREVTQPFKQAHREIYILTDAERETETYSNRFAAHILRQHQFNALCQERGWDYRLQGAWDSFNVPSLSLKDAGLRAEYWVEGIDDDNGGGQSHAGIYLYVTTDQVRFTALTSGDSVPLEEVPKRIFSEVMRDVDLFVGVANIGADPNWLDGGDGRLAGQQDYWWAYAFGDLTEGAEVRRDTLARLLPRMTKLAARWELEGRFLKIRGDLRSYKIHLGSGNIMMEPNDQYLCIVPGRSTGNRRSSNGIFLPFEGDRNLSVIISKALMLAEDTKIKDPTIIRQIQHGA